MSPLGFLFLFLNFITLCMMTSVENGIRLEVLQTHFCVEF